MVPGTAFNSFCTSDRFSCTFYHLSCTRTTFYHRNQHTSTRTTSTLTCTIDSDCMGPTKKNDALRSVVKLRIAAGVRAGVKRQRRRQRESDAAAVSTSSCATLPIAKRAKHMHTYIDTPHTIAPAAWNAYPDRVTRLRLATFTRTAAVQPTDARPTTHPTIPTIMYGGASID